MANARSPCCRCSTLPAFQPEIDAAAVALYEQAPRLAKDYLTRYSKETGDAVVARWRELGEFLIWRYLDGNLKNELGEVTHPGYPESWYEKVAAATGERLEMIQLTEEKEREERAAAEAKEKARGLADGIVALLGARGIVIDDETRAAILESDDVDRLQEWLVRAATADTASEVVAEE